MPAKVSIRTAAKRAGLTTHVIRAWEKRYQLLDPARTDGGHRMYSEADVQRLTLVARAVRSGHSIGSIARLTEAQLHVLLEKAYLRAGGIPPKGGPADRAETFINAILSALPQLNSRQIDRTLEQAQVSLGWQGLLQLVIAPAAKEIGNRWRSGLITSAHEHFFTSAVKVYLGHLTRQYAAPKGAPRIVVGTPNGQMHELGAILAAASAANIGWEVAYLGPSLPSADLVGAALNFNAKVLALSIVYPEDDLLLPKDLMEIGRLTPKGIQIIAGGQAASAYTDPLTSIGALICEDLSKFCDALDLIRRAAVSKPQPFAETTDPTPHLSNS